MEEGINLMRALWTQEEASYDGECVQFGPSWADPKPAAHIPLIIGAGGVGLAGICMAKSVVDAKLVVAVIDPAKRAAALAAGADIVIDNNNTGAAAELMEKAGGGVHGVIDFVGAPASSGFAMQTLARGGTIVVVGLFGGAVPLPLASLPLRMMSVVGSYVGTLGEMHALMALVKAGKDTPVPITPRPLREAGQAIADFRDGKTVGRYVLTNLFSTCRGHLSYGAQHQAAICPR